MPHALWDPRVSLPDGVDADRKREPASHAKQGESAWGIHFPSSALSRSCCLALVFVFNLSKTIARAGSQLGCQCCRIAARAHKQSCMTGKLFCR